MNTSLSLILFYICVLSSASISCTLVVLLTQQFKLNVEQKLSSEYLQSVNGRTLMQFPTPTQFQVEPLIWLKMREVNKLKRSFKLLLQFKFDLNYLFFRK
ncbi:Hypothetical_protein [Hexamita inflata]|uniref:Hypothetical_protein n=1 Tax=Hexamita inflata TaxID=28002 RepID=A0AA86QIA5_9EUKA|nr:Hypothetical protein HINF_LOCUS44441 [Hexamita inflata]